jgi:hypothetical protein
MKWPAQSPDLNPIENLCDHLDRATRKENGGRLESREELLEAAQRASILKKFFTELPKTALTNMFMTICDVCLQ